MGLVMNYWVFTIGLRDQRPPEQWLVEWPHHANEMWFPTGKPPRSINAHDLALLYGSQRRGFIGAVEVLSGTPQRNPADSHFTWKYRLLISKVADGNIAAPETAGINPNRIVRGPHSSIEEQDYRRGLAVLLEAAGRGAS